MYRPRSRGETTSPMMVIDRAMRPPPPAPCSPRDAISWPIVCAAPEATEPIMNSTIANWKRFLRPYMSEILPYSGTDTVDASRQAVTTQDRWLSPPSSPTMVGRAVDTIVWSKAASSIAVISPAKTPRIWRCDSGPAADGAGELDTGVSSEVMWRGFEP